MTDPISFPHLKLLGQRQLSKEHLPVGTGAVAVDIDDTAGALVVIGDADTVGLECFVRRANGFHRHVWFLDRMVEGSSNEVAAVFSSLEPGRYMVDIEGALQLGEVEVAAGSVVTFKPLAAQPS